MAMPQLQIIVVLSTLFISAATFLLARRLLVAYKAKKAISYLLWGIGVGLFGLAAFLEVLFALNIYSSALIGFYWFIVVILVQFLSFGSVELTKNKTYKKVYYAFSVVVAALVLLSVIFVPEPSQALIIQNYVVAGLPSLAVTITSLVGTFAASIVLVVIAGKSYMKTHSKKMLSIIAGVVIVATAGSFYIVAIPEFLYFAEFAGVVLLWLGFS